MLHMTAMTWAQSLGRVLAFLCDSMCMALSPLRVSGCLMSGWPLSRFDQLGRACLVLLLCIDLSAYSIFDWIS